jgi:hypothetical protein
MMWNPIKSKMFSDHVGYIRAHVFSEEGKWKFVWNWESNLMPLPELKGFDGPFDTRQEAQAVRQTFITTDQLENPNRQYDIVDD